MKLRDYCADDLNFIERINSFCAICIKYHRDVAPENILCVVDEKNDVIGVGYLTFSREKQTIDSNKIEFSTYLDKAHTGDMIIEGLLVDGLIRKYHSIRDNFPEKKLCLRICCETEEIEDMQLFLEKGFSLHSVIPVMKYDLNKKTEHFQIPDDVEIQELPLTEEWICKYINADYLASGNPESLADVLFKSGNPSFKCFVAKCNSEVVGAISVWNLTDERAATDNIFVSEAFRRKNIARELIATAFDELKKRGMKTATLSVKGTNLRAMKLYLSCGYSLFYNLIEMIYE